MHTRLDVFYLNEPDYDEDNIVWSWGVPKTNMQISSISWVFLKASVGSKHRTRMVFTSGDECDRCHKTFDYQVTFDNHKKNYQCYKEDKESTCTTCGNDFRNKFLLADHTR